MDAPKRFVYVLRSEAHVEVVVLFAREPREVEDNNEVNLALVRPAVLEEPLQLGRSAVFALSPSSLNGSGTSSPSLRHYSLHARSCVGRL